MATYTVGTEADFRGRIADAILSPESDIIELSSAITLTSDLNVAALANSGALTITSVAGQNYGLSGAFAVKFSGATTFTLSSTNTYSGGTTVSGGAVLFNNHNNGGTSLDAVGALGSTITLDNGSYGNYSVNSDQQISTTTQYNFAIGSGGGKIIGGGIFIAGTVSDLNPAQAGTLNLQTTVYYTQTGDNFSGATVLSNAASATSLGVNTFPSNSGFQVGAGTSISLEEGGDQTIASLSDGPNGAGGGSIVTSGSALGSGQTFLTIRGSASASFSGNLTDGQFGRPLGLTLATTHTGTQILSGASLYTGNTTINGGTLLVTGSLGNTAVSVAASASLGGASNAGTPGTGTIGGSVIVSGTLSAGATALSDIGALTTGNLTFADGGTYRADLNAGANSADRVRASDVDFVTTAGATITLDLRVTGALTSAAGQSVTLIENIGAVGAVSTSGRFTRVTNNGVNFATISTAANSFSFGGRTYALNYAGGDGNDVTITDVTAPVGGGGGSDPTPPGPSAGDDNLVGTAGPDTISLGLGNDTFAGGAGNDLVYGNQGNDLIYGNQDADTLYGGQGDDRAFGGQGDDRLFGNLGNDVLSGNLGNDIVYGNQGADIVYGNQGADILFGGQGNDVLYGGQGADTLVGGIGDDTLVGGLGADLYRFDPNSGRDLILGFNQGEGDRIALGGQTYTVSSAQNGDALLLLSGGGVVDLAGIRADQVNAAYFAA